MSYIVTLNSVSKVIHSGACPPIDRARQYHMRWLKHKYLSFDGHGTQPKTIICTEAQPRLYYLTVLISFGIISFPHLVAIPLERMGSILLVNMSSSENIWAFLELSIISYDPSESNLTCSDDSTLEESMWHVIFFEIVQKTKGLFFGVDFWRLLSCLPTANTLIFILCPGSSFLSCKVNCWHFYPIELDFE